MSDSEKTPAGEIRALARLLLVDEKELLEKAQAVQEGLTDLDEMGFHTFYYLKGILLGKQSKTEPLPFEPEEDEEEDEDEWEDKRTEDEKYWDGYWANREDNIESRDIERAIEKGWWGND